jgi:hypothetical protein
MVDQSVFRCVALGLESTEESLFSTKNLNSRGGVFREVGEGTSVGDETGTDGVSDEGSEIGSDDTHLVGEVFLEGFSVIVEVDDSGSEIFDVEVIDGGDVGTHRGAGSVENVASEDVVVAEEFSERFEDFFRELRFVSEKMNNFGVLVVVRDDPDELGEVPSVPFSDSHGERVDILVHLIEKGDSLNNHVVGTVDVELYFRARVGVSETELGTLRVAFFETCEEFLLVETDSSEEFEGTVGSVAVDVEGCLDRRSETTFFYTEDNSGLLGEVEFEETVKEFVNDTCNVT